MKTGSILAGLDDTLQIGDYNVDPFGVLEVDDIEVDGLEVFLYFLKEEIDLNHLQLQTSNLNIDSWSHLTDTAAFIVQSKITKEYVLRFVWWICNEIVYGDQFTPNHRFSPGGVSIRKISKQDSLYKTIPLYIYNCISSYNDTYKIELTLPTGNSLTIRFKNKINKL